ncbi:MAG: NfeD family protein [Planctomycetes bacterium]|nr:NfeD family protein [Planctomycetota bacterium]
MGTDVLEFIYLVCFFLGLGFALLSGLLSGVFSGHAGAHIDPGAHLDTGGGADGGGSIDGAHPSGHVHYSPLSPVTIAMFISTFGGVGILLKKAGYPMLIHLPAAAFSGIVVGGLVSYAFYRIMLGTQASSHARANEAIGIEAEVTVPIPHVGVGEVAYVLRGSRYTNPAKTVDGKELPVNTVVKIVKQIGTAFVVQKVS